MPTSYGQVKGRKYTNVQPIHDPNNPKPTRYPAHVKNWSGALPAKPVGRVILEGVKHGGWAYQKGCRCDACRAAHKAQQREYRERMKGGA